MNPVTIETITDKIRKLQALADRAGSEHEAALASQRVAELCRLHNLDIGVARLEQEETTATDSEHTHTVARWEAHWSSIATAVEKLFDVGCYRGRKFRVMKDSRGMVLGQTPIVATHFYGLKANVESALMTYEYLLASVEAMLESHMITTPCRSMSDQRSFRMGCAARIRDEALKVSRAAAQLTQADSESMALVRLGNQLVANHAKSLHLRHGSGVAGARNRDHYSAGYSAGGRVDIHGARKSRMIR